MSRTTFQELRLPLALSLVVLVAVLVFLPRGGDEPAGGDERPVASVVAGEPGGGVAEPESAAPSEGSPAASEGGASMTPEATAAPTPVPTPVPTAERTPPPPPPDGFTAEVLACRSISGSTCVEELRNMPPNVTSFTALVRFTAGKPGDVINVILNGPSGPREGGAYALTGNGAGYYYSMLAVGDLPPGRYTLTATRNGTEVAVTGFRRLGR